MTAPHEVDPELLDHLLRQRADADNALAGDPDDARARWFEADAEAKLQIIDHANEWAATCRQAPEGWSEAGCTGYRMALDWVLDRLHLPYDGQAGD